ncbi:hypothetical protein ACOSQ4_003954 [Xanthoceras sorbifolium]
MVPPPPRGRMNRILMDIWCLICKVCKKYKKQTLAMLFVLLEVISVILDIFGKNTLGFLVASFVLSAFGVVLTLYTTFIIEEGDGNQLVAVEIVFSFVQLVVTYIDMLVKILRIKSDYKVSIFPLAFAIVALVFTFKNNPVDRPSPPSGESVASQLTQTVQWVPLDVELHASGPAIWLECMLVALRRRFLQYVQRKIIKVFELIGKYKIHMFVGFPLVLEAISVALDLSGQSKQSFLLATSLLPVFGFAVTVHASINKGRTTGRIKPQAKTQLIGVVEIVFAMVQLIIATFIHFTLTISGATNNYNPPWFPLAFAAIVVFVFNKYEKNDSFKVPMLTNGVRQRFIDLKELSCYEDLYNKVEQTFNIEGQLRGSKSEWELTYITDGYQWREVESDQQEIPWRFFRCEVSIMIIRKRERGFIGRDSDNNE